MFYICSMKGEIVTLSKEKLQSAARLLKVVAHPVKLDILQILRTKDSMDVTSLCECIGADCEISMMSHHLAKMRDNGILESNKDGKQVFYSIADPSIFKLLDCLNQCDLV